MDDMKNRILLGKILGEIYRMQMEDDHGICKASEGTIYGLIHGVELAIDEEIERIGFLSTNKLEHVIDVLEKYDDISGFAGFRQIEKELRDGGVDKTDAKRAFMYLKINDQFADIIDKMGENMAPNEMKNINPKL